MARTGSQTGTRTTRKTAAEKRAEAEQAQAATATTPDETNTEAAPAEVESITEAEEPTTMSDTTVETETVEVPDSDTTVETSTEPTEAAELTEAEATAAKLAAEHEQAFVNFQAIVATALDDRDTSTGTLPDVQTEAVKEAFRALSGAKYKSKAKKFLNDELKSAVNGRDLVLGTAVMGLHDAVENAGPAQKPTVERKPSDPAQAYRDRLTTLHIAYNLARENAPDGIDATAEQAKVEEKVGELSESAETYYKWVVSTDENKGDEPEVDALVKKAVKASQGKAASAGRATSTSTPRPAGDGTRRNVRTHIAQVFADAESGTFMKVAEIAKQATEEYPGADCSPGAINAALKSAKGVEGFALATDDSGHAGARKL